MSRKFECPKCLFRAVSVEYRPEWVERNATPMMADRKPERLVCTCERCKYAWVEPVSTDDSKEGEE